MLLKSYPTIYLKYFNKTRPESLKDWFKLKLFLGFQIIQHTKNSFLILKQGHTNFSNAIFNSIVKGTDISEFELLQFLYRKYLKLPG